jgi:hypothetical protein
MAVQNWRSFFTVPIAANVETALMARMISTCVREGRLDNYTAGQGRMVDLHQVLSSLEIVMHGVKSQQAKDGLKAEIELLQTLVR